MKSKIRIRRSEDDKVYVVKTSKFISEEDCQKIQSKREGAKLHHKSRKGSEGLKGRPPVL